MAKENYVTEKESPNDYFPLEILTHLFTFFTPDELKNVRQVCQTWLLATENVCHNYLRILSHPNKTLSATVEEIGREILQNAPNNNLPYTFFSSKKFCAFYKYDKKVKNNPLWKKDKEFYTHIQNISLENNLSGQDAVRKLHKDRTKQSERERERDGGLSIRRSIVLVYIFSALLMALLFTSSLLLADINTSLSLASLTIAGGIFFLELSIAPSLFLIDRYRQHQLLTQYERVNAYMPFWSQLSSRTQESNNDEENPLSPSVSAHSFGTLHHTTDENIDRGGNQEDINNFGTGASP